MALTYVCPILITKSLLFFQKQLSGAVQVSHVKLVGPAVSPRSIYLFIYFILFSYYQLANFAIFYRHMYKENHLRSDGDVEFRPSFHFLLKNFHSSC